MPHTAMKFVGGVNQNETPVLNEAGISTCQLIRYKPDGRYVLAEKLGGWTRFFSSAIVSIVRNLWAWRDTEGFSHLAVGAENQSGTYQSQLSVITDGVQQNITPGETTDNITAVVSSTAGSSIITITDATTQNITQFDSVYIPAHIAIGGVILFGLYACNPDGHSATTTYTVQAKDALGNALLAPGSSSSPTLALFTTTSGSSLVTITLAAHGYVVGNLYPVLIPTTVGGITFTGHYPIQSITDANNFVIVGSNTASTSTSGNINNNKARYIYSIGIGAIPSGTGYGIGGYGRGGYGTGTAIVPATGTPVSAVDWTLGNWGEILVAVPVDTPITLTTVSASGNATTGTIVFSESYAIPVGTGIVVSDMLPVTWNGTYLVTASTANSVSFLTSVVAAQTQAGSILVQATPFDPIYVWDPESGSPIASAIPTGPPVNAGAFIAMPQRQIIAWGSTFTGIQDPLLIRWCDLNNYFVWIGQITNQAGSFRIPKGSRIVACMQGPQQGLIWTDVGVWTMQYINQPLVYSFNEIGSGCGLIGRKAMAWIMDRIIWMGASQFFTLDEAGVSPVMCDVWDVIFQNLDQDNLEKIRAAVNSLFGEVTWYYPSLNGGGEVDSYVKYNVYLKMWDFGTLGRSAWVDQSVLGEPIGSDPSNRLLYQHETSPDADGQALLASLQSGYYAMNEGDLKTFVDQIWPDMKFGYYGGMQNATVNITFYVADYAGQTPSVYGPYPFTQATQYITSRFRGRLVSIGLSSSDVGSFWRIGGIRYRFAPDGKF